MSRRLLGLVLGAMLFAAACGNSSTTGSSSTEAPTTGGSASPSSSASVPPGCGSGVAKDLPSTMQIITDGPECPGSVNKFWKDQLGDKWTTPTFFAYNDGDLPDSPCAEGATADEFAENAFYCDKDDRIGYSRDLLENLFQQGGPYLPTVVLMHELGHRANNLGGHVGVVSRSEENQADCDAGVTTKFARDAKRLPLTDVFKSAQLLYQLGDRRNFGKEMAPPNAHGTPTERAGAFGRGYLQKIQVCQQIALRSDGTIF